MCRASWLLTPWAPWAALVSLGAVTTTLLVLSLASSSSSFLQDAAPAYEYDDSLYSSDVTAPAAAVVPRRGPGYPPVLAYYISGGRGDSVRMTRLLKAAYHPRNRYLLHLDAGAGAYERARLAGHVRASFLEFGNVHVVGKGDPVDGRGASAMAAVLHGASVLMRVGADWDWLVTLAASDYPLVTQDGESTAAVCPVVTLSLGYLPMISSHIMSLTNGGMCAQTFSTPSRLYGGASTSSTIEWISIARRRLSSTRISCRAPTPRSPSRRGSAQSLTRLSSSEVSA